MFSFYQIILSYCQYHSLSFNHEYIHDFLSGQNSKLFLILFCIFSQNFCSHFRLWCGTCRDAVSYLISSFSFMQPIVLYLISSLHFLQAIIQFKVDQAVSVKVCMHLDGPTNINVSAAPKIDAFFKTSAVFLRSRSFPESHATLFLRYLDIWPSDLWLEEYISNWRIAILVCGPIVQYSIHLLRTFGLRLLPLSIMLMQRFVQGPLLPWN